MRKLTFIIMTLALAGTGPGLSLGASASDPTFQPRSGAILGIVPTLNRKATVSTSSPPGRLYYNGGPVMPTNKVYAIYWVPRGYTVSGNYETLINRYFSDVSADHGKNSNVYVSDTQYYQQRNGATTYVQNNSTFEGSVVDSNPLPALDPANCPDVASPLNGTNGTPSTPTSCVTDAQVQQEISNVIKANNLPVDNLTEFFMFTAKNIGSCFPNGVSAGPQYQTAPVCSFQTFCAYHSSYYDPTVNPNSQIIYANMPYAAETAGLPVTCDTGNYPNNDDADPTISIASHEHNESITDPFGTGWWDSNSNDSTSGNENGDMCNFNFGTLSGPSGAQYNQTINGHHYLLQQEWDNLTSSCVQSETPAIALTPNIGYPTAPFKIRGLFFQAGEPASFTFTGAGSSGPESVGSATADAAGQLVFKTSVPTDAQPGTAVIGGSGSLSGAARTATFMVPSY
jgi:hypothetical protein